MTKIATVGVGLGEETIPNPLGVLFLLRSPRLFFPLPLFSEYFLRLLLFLQHLPRLLLFLAFALASLLLPLPLLLFPRDGVREGIVHSGRLPIPGVLAEGGPGGAKGHPGFGVAEAVGQRSLGVEQARVGPIFEEEGDALGRGGEGGGGGEVEGRLALGSGEGVGVVFEEEGGHGVEVGGSRGEVEGSEGSYGRSGGRRDGGWLGLFWGSLSGWLRDRLVGERSEDAALLLRARSLLQGG